MPAFNNCNFVVISGTSSATIGTETTHAHNQNTKPYATIILAQGNGLVYESKAPDATNFFIKAAVASIPFTAILVFLI